MIGKTWKRATDIHGHEPLFEVRCKFCGEKMFTRYSKVFPARDVAYGISEPTNQMAYKCPECAWVCRFNVVDEQGYIKELLDRRGGVDLYVPPVETWISENEQIRRQLEALGYVGGR